MKYIVYQTTNVVNNKIYVGIHGTEDPDVFDGYIGNSINIYEPNPELCNPKLAFHRAVKKYGIDAFKRETIKVFDTIDEAKKLEAEIVNEEFLKRKDVYNMTLGGSIPPVHDKRVYQYSLDGKFIKEWESLTKAAQCFNTMGNIIGISANHKRTALGYLWSFDKKDKIDISEYNVDYGGRTVYLYDKNGKYIRSSKSMYSCAKELNVYLSEVQRAISLGNIVGEYYISYFKNDIFIKLEQIKVAGNIHQYNLDGSYIRSYESINDINEFNKFDVARAIKEKRTHKNFIWICGEKAPSVPSRKGKGIKRRVGQYSKDGKLIKIFDSTTEAKENFPNVGKVLRGQAPHCHNFIFKYMS